MADTDQLEKYKARLKELETLISEANDEIVALKELLAESEKKHWFFQLIADFTFGWELWFEPSGKIIYCSPSCFDLTGFTANQVIAGEGINDMLVYPPDREKFTSFLNDSLNQALLAHWVEFRILTRTRQLRWCLINVRGVYDKQGKYLGIRASIQDITRLKRAMGQIHELETVREFEDRTRQRLQTELQHKDRELVDFLLLLSQKNELVSKISSQLKNIEIKGAEKNKKQLKKILELVDEKSEPMNWPMVETQLEKVHPGFFSRLVAKHPILTIKDKKLCGYLRLGLTSKEISGLLNISYKSVEIARVRLRKKLKTPNNSRITNYLIQI